MCNTKMFLYLLTKEKLREPKSFVKISVINTVKNKNCEGSFGRRTPWEHFLPACKPATGSKRKLFWFVSPRAQEDSFGNNGLSARREKDGLHCHGPWILTPLLATAWHFGAVMMESGTEAGFNIWSRRQSVTPMKTPHRGTNWTMQGYGRTDLPKIPMSVQP